MRLCHEEFRVRTEIHVREAHQGTYKQADCNRANGELSHAACYRWFRLSAEPASQIAWVFTTEMSENYALDLAISCGHAGATMR